MSLRAVRALGEADAALAAGKVDDAARALAGVGDELSPAELDDVWRALGHHHLGADPPALRAAATGGLRGRNVYATHPTGAKLGENVKEWNKQITALDDAPRLHQARMGFVAYDAQKLDKATFELTLTPPGALAEERVAIELQLVPASDLPPAHAGAGDPGPARVQLVEIPNPPVGEPKYKATIQLDETLLAENLEFALGHELDEIADAVALGTVKQFAAQSQAGIFVEATYAQLGAAVTNHDRAVAREYLNVLGDLLEKRAQLTTLQNKKKLSPHEAARLPALQSEVGRREASEQALRASMGLDALENRAAKNEVLREAMQDHPHQGRLENYFYAARLRPQDPTVAEQWSLDVGADEFDTYVRTRPQNAPPSVMNPETVAHLKVPEPVTIDQFLAGGLYGGHETQSVEAFVENNPNYWLVLDKTKVGADGIEYRSYKQFMWNPRAGAGDVPPPRPPG